MAKIEVLDFHVANLIAAGEEVGRIVYVLEGKEIGYVPVLAENAVERMDFSTLFCRILRKMIVL